MNNKNTYYEINKEKLLNRAKQYHDKNKERLGELTKNKYRELSNKEKK